jgi:hypothetical protein
VSRRVGVFRRINVLGALMMGLLVGSSQTAQAAACDATWRAQSTAGLPPTALLADVSVTGQGDVWAVGASGDRGLLAHRTAGSWHSTRYSVPGRTVAIDSVDAVPGAAWAVGSLWDSRAETLAPLLLANTGAGWRRLAIPASVSTAFLKSVVVRQASDVWIGGLISHWPQADDPIALHWDGRRLSVLRVPFKGFALGIEAPRAGGVVLVGQSQGRDFGAQAWRWNGSAWSRDVMPPDPFGEEPLLLALDSANGRSWAVGRSIGGCCSVFPFVYRWTESRWVENTPDFERGASLNDVLVSAPDRHVVVVGESFCGDGSGCPDFSADPLVMEWTGSRWIDRAVVGVRSDTDSRIAAIDGDGRGNRWAVGTRDAGPLVLRQCTATGA